MRIVRIFFTAVCVFLLLGGAVVLLGRELLLYQGLSQLRSAARSLTTLQAEPNFVQSCLEYGGPPTGTLSLVHSQLRFTSDTTFVLEAVCTSTDLLRQEFREETLPMLVAKQAGQSGLVSQQDQQGITLSVLGRSGTVYIEGGLTKTVSKPLPEQAMSEGPTTVCAGYGFRCCNEVHQLGEGEHQSAAWDCPRSCYTQCIEKPAVLIFNSTPLPDPTTRTVTIRSGETLEFVYVVNDTRGNVFAAAGRDDLAGLSWPERLVRTLSLIFSPPPPADALNTVTLRFGDGSTTELSDLQGTAQHAYTCSGTVCVYHAAIQVTTKAGVTSAIGPAETIEVQVVP